MATITRRRTEVNASGPVCGRGLQEFQLFGVPKNGPGHSARPGAERRVALLGIGATITAVVQIKDAFMRRSATDIVGIPAFAVIDAVAGSRFSMFQQSFKQGDFPVALAHKDMAELVREREGTQGAH